MGGMRHPARGTVAAVMALGLAGCWSGDPSASNMLQALNDNHDWRLGLALLLKGEQAAAGIMKESTVEKSSCAQAQGSPGYICDFRWGWRQSDGKIEYSHPIKGRFFKTGNQWAVELIK